eukprot:Tamp_19973.p1 GENE.Tamp_19973~~Tamp_19973.p1  ORF type:complete len:379 (+),score=83.22 Tamp_19973:72-1139(+)
MPPTVIKDPKLSLKGHAYWCRDVTWSPDGELLATASADNHVRVFQSDGTEAFKVKHPDWVWACDFSFTAKRKRLATACLDGRVRILDATSGRELMNIQAHGNQTVNCVCFSPNGEQLLSGSYDKTARIFSVSNGKEQFCCDAYKGPVLSGAFTTDSLHALTGSSTGQLVILDASTGAVVQRIENAHGDRINSIAASPDGQLVATGSGDKTSKIWQKTKTAGGGKWEQIKTLKSGDEVTALSWSPCQLLLAVGCADNFVRVYHASDGWAELARIKQHSDEVNGVSIVNKGTRTLLATASDDKTASIFDLSATTVQLKVAAAKAGKPAALVTAQGAEDGSDEQAVTVGDPADMEGLD